MNIASHRGFTLVELIIVIVLLAVLAAIAIPSYSNMIITNRMTTEVNSFVSDLHYAKTEAIKRSRNVQICASNTTQTNCAANATNWGENGWMVIDPESTEVLRVQDPLNGSDEFHDISSPAAPSTGVISFNRYGFASGSVRSFRLCGPYGKPERIKGVVVQASGRIRLAADVVGGDQIVEAIVNGAPVNMSC